MTHCPSLVLFEEATYAILRAVVVRALLLMSSMLLLVFCLGLGVLTARFGKPPVGLAQALNWYVLNIALTALILHLMPQLNFNWDVWFLFFSMWLVFLCSWGLFTLIGRAAGWSHARIGALTLVGGIGNTAFVGFPFVEALRGQEGLQLAVIVDQVGSFTALAIGGSVLVSLYKGRSLSISGVAKNVLKFPPFIAMWCGVLVGLLGEWPALLDTTFERLGSTLTPLALFSVGLQLRPLPPRGQAVPVTAVLTWKLLVAPALVFAAAVLFGIGGLERTVAVLESSMPPSVAASILCQQHELEPQLANTALGLGLLLSLGTVVVVNQLLG
jgi:malate permease and related proteins